MAAPEPDHYAVLDVARTATEVEIRTAYRRLAREYHPDANPSPEAEQRMRLAEGFLREALLGLLSPGDEFNEELVEQIQHFLAL